MWVCIFEFPAPGTGWYPNSGIHGAQWGQIFSPIGQSLVIVSYPYVSAEQTSFCSCSCSSLLLLHAPGEVVGLGGGGVLVHEALHDLPRRVHLVQVVREHLLFAELVCNSIDIRNLRHD